MLFVLTKPGGGGVTTLSVCAYDVNRDPTRGRVGRRLMLCSNHADPEWTSIGLCGADQPRRLFQGGARARTATVPTERDR